MRECGPTRWVAFDRDDRDYITWSSTGLSSSATAAVELEASGTWIPLTVDHVTGDLTGLFAGPDHVSPGSAVVVPVTSHVVIRIVDGLVQRDLDGGFIHLVP
jgi:hypothetical protein